MDQRGENWSEAIENLQADTCIHSDSPQPSTSTSNIITSILDDSNSEADVIATSPSPSQPPSLKIEHLSLEGDVTPPQDYTVAYVDSDYYDSEEESDEDEGIEEEEEEEAQDTWAYEFEANVSELIATNDPERRHANLTEICRLMNFCADDRLLLRWSSRMARKLVEIAGGEDGPEIILLTIRAITYIWDVDRNASFLLRQEGAISIICGRLLAMENMDVAEQCLEALDKISNDRPACCLQAGAAMACLSYIEFFSPSIQRVALYVVANMCEEIPPHCFPFILEAYPSLCNILDHEDSKLVEVGVTCLVDIADSFRDSPDILDELSSYELIQKCAKMILPNGQLASGQEYRNDLIKFLAVLASGSLKAVQILLELNISNMLKDILNAYDAPLATGSRAIINNEFFDQVLETLSLAIHLLPHNDGQGIIDQLSLAKKKILVKHPKLLHQFAMDIIPVMIQVVNSGANLNVCYACAYIVTNILNISPLDMLLDVLKDANISRFLARLFSQKDHHVLIHALRIVDVLLQRHPDIFLDIFVKEGVAHEIGKLSTENGHYLVPDSTKASSTSSQMNPEDHAKCLCYSFDLGSDASPQSYCKLGKNAVLAMVKHVNDTYFTSSGDFSSGSTETLRKLKSYSTLLNAMVDKAERTSDTEESLTWVLEKMVSELNDCKELTPFELIDSGVLKSFAHYLCNGQYLHQKSDCKVSQSHATMIFHRLDRFKKVIFSKCQQNSQQILVQKLQNALSFLDDFPIIRSLSYKPRETYATIPFRHYTRQPCLIIQFVRHEHESILKKYPFFDEVLVESSSSLEDVETFLLLYVESDDAKNHSELVEGTGPKLVFYLDGQEIEESLTLYQAILQHKMHTNRDFVVGPEFWRQVYTVTYKRADPKVSSEVLQELLDQSGNLWRKLPFFSSLLHAEFPSKLDRSLASYDILFILQVLEGLNKCYLRSEEQNSAFVEEKVLEHQDLTLIEHAFPLSEFVSIKMTEKLERQMRDVLTSSTGIMPAWFDHLVFCCPFLFAFETRCKYFQLALFHVSEIQRHAILQQSGDRYSRATVPSRTKFKVDRSCILESAATMMELHARSHVVLEVEYTEEVGTGLGPTMEFFTLVSQEFQKVGIGMWRMDYSSSTYYGSEYVHAPQGFFPRPWSPAKRDIEFSVVIKKFTLLGQIVAKAVQDKRVFDLPFSKAFYKLILDQELDIYDIQSFDPILGRTLLALQSLAKRKRISESKSEETNDLLFQDAQLEDLCIEFSLPGYPDYEFLSTNDYQMVNGTNLEEYVSLVVDATIKSGILKQVEAFKLGFDEVFPLASLQMFSENEIGRLFCGDDSTWDVGELLEHIEFDHGYTASSFPAVNFLEVIQEFDRDQRRAFLQFVTGAPRLPTGGMASLHPKLTVVCKHCDDSADLTLPSVMTCVNYLKLPAYSSKEIMREKLLYAITEGQCSFHLS